MLQTTNQSVFRQVNCVIDGVTVASFAMTVSNSGEQMPSYRTIVDQDKYIANMDAVNKDFQDFQSSMYAEQDKILKEVVDMGEGE